MLKIIGIEGSVKVSPQEEPKEKAEKTATRLL